MENELTPLDTNMQFFAPNIFSSISSDLLLL